MACGELLALSATLIMPEKEPVAVGENVTVIVQVAFTATEAQLEELPKRLALSSIMQFLQD